MDIDQRYISRDDKENVLFVAINRGASVVREIIPLLRYFFTIHTFQIFSSRSRVSVCLSTQGDTSVSGFFSQASGPRSFRGGGGGTPVSEGGYPVPGGGTGVLTRGLTQSQVEGTPILTRG